MALAPRAPAIPPSPDFAALEATIRALPVEERERLARLFEPSALRSARLAERDTCYLALAEGLRGDAEQLAEAVHRAVAHYAAGAWRYEQGKSAPGNAVHALAHRILTIDNGAVLSVRSLRRIFVAVAKNRSGNGHDFKAQSDQS